MCLQIVLVLVRLVLWEGDIGKLVNVCVWQWQGVPFISLSGDATIRAIGDIGIWMRIQ